MTASRFAFAVGFALASVLAPAAGAAVLAPALSPVTAPGQGAWRRLDPDIAWGEPAAVVDPVGDRLVVLPDGLDAIWSLDLANPTAWTSTPVGRDFTGGRDGQPIVYDQAHDRWFWVRLGSSNPNQPSELWVLEPSSAPATWGRLAQGFTPGKRHFASVVFDDAENRIVAFGGVPDPLDPSDPYYVRPDRILTDTWTFDVDDGFGWQPLATTGIAPRVAPGAGAFYDAVNRRMLVLGSDMTNDAGSAPVRLWALSLDSAPAWTVVTDVSSNELWGQVYGSAFFLDVARGRILVHGGRREALHAPYLQSLVEAIDVTTGASRYLDFGNPEPGGRWAHAFAYDTKRDRLMLQGGWPAVDRKGASRETWALALGDGAGWARLGPWEGGPPWREGEVAAWDPVGERVVTWGGGSDFPCLYFYCGTRVHGDVWSWDLSATGERDWDLHPGPPGEGRVNASLVHDPLGGRLVAFGGIGNPSPPVTFFEDTIHFPLESPGLWSLLPAPGASPEARHRHAAIVDAARGRMLVLGGSSSFAFGGPESPLRDAWSYDLAGTGGWTRLGLDPASPVPEPGFQAALQTGGDRVLAVSWPTPQTTPSVWELPLAAPTTWSRVEVAPGDAPLFPGRVTWDPVRGRLLLFEYVPLGFFTPATVRAWALEVGPPARWRRLAPENAAAVPELVASHVVYDAVHDRFVIAHPGPRTQVWALELGTPRWPITLSWARNGSGQGNGRGGGGASHRIVLHSASPIGSPIAPRPIDLSRVDPANWTWTGVEPRTDGQGRMRIEVADVDGDGSDDWIVDVRRTGGSVRGGVAVGFAATDRDGVRLEGTLDASGEAAGYALHDVAADAPASRDLFAVGALVSLDGAPRLSLATASQEPVTATLFDVRGRRLASRTWTPVGDLAQTIALAGTARLAPGIYLARVRQGSRAATVRLVNF